MAAAELEAFASDLQGEGERSVVSRLAKPVEECVGAYGGFCATRADDAFFWEADDGFAPTNASRAAALSPPPSSLSDNPFASSGAVVDEPKAAANPFAGGAGGAGGPFDAPVPAYPSSNPSNPSSPGSNGGFEYGLNYSGAEGGANGGGSGGGSGGGGDAAAQPEPAWAAQSSAGESALPPGWSTAVDPASGNTYYVGPNSEVRAWEPARARSPGAGAPALQLTAPPSSSPQRQPPTLTPR